MAGNKKKFNGTISREQLKTNLCGLMISEMTLSNQSHFPQFFSPRKMTYRNLADSGLRQAGIACSRKMTAAGFIKPSFQIWQDGFPGPPNSGR
jgi:hypothetical protein